VKLFLKIVDIYIEERRFKGVKVQRFKVGKGGDLKPINL